MTPKTQCKHKHTEQRLTQHWENYCLDCNTYSSEAEPASTGEPPPTWEQVLEEEPKSQPWESLTERLCPCDRVDCMYCGPRIANRVINLAARPSEPSALRLDIGGTAACSTDCKNGVHSAECIADHTKAAAPQTSAEPPRLIFEHCGVPMVPTEYGFDPFPGLKCEKCGWAMREITDELVRQRFKEQFERIHFPPNPAAPQPVSGGAPKVEEIILRAVDKCNPSTDGERFCLYNIIEMAINESRPYFPPASQTPPVDLNDVREDIGDAIQALRSGWPADDVINILKECSESINLPATPASTARTDGPENMRSQPIDEVHANSMTSRSNTTPNGGPQPARDGQIVARNWDEQCKATNIIGAVTWHCQRKIHNEGNHYFGNPELPAAPGSVPQAEPPKER